MGTFIQFVSCSDEVRNHLSRARAAIADRTTTSSKLLEDTVAPLEPGSTMTCSFLGPPLTDENRKSHQLASFPFFLLCFRFARTHARTLTQTHTYARTHTRARTHTHTHARKHTHATHARTHARAHAHTRTHARTHARTHTHTHTQGCPCGQSKIFHHKTRHMNP